LQYKCIEILLQEKGFKNILNGTAAPPQPAPKERGSEQPKIKPHPEGCGLGVG